jgi:lipid-binding SYLF domain-containing protein
VAFCLGLTLALPAIAAGSPIQKSPPANEISKVEDSIRVLQEMMKETDKSIPRDLLEKSAGIAIIPDVIKAAYVIGGRHDSGVVLVRRQGGSWSDPAFISLTGGSIGWQIGVQSADIILVFMTQRSIENFSRNKFTLGADAGIAAGPIGRTAEASTDAQLKAEIYSYSRSRGLFAGLALQGASLHADAKANQEFYGINGIGAPAIFEGKVDKVPEVAGKLRKVLEDFSRPAK